MSSRALHRFEAMGCEVVVCGGSQAERRAVELLFAEREQIFSRFLAGSELNRVNSLAGQPIVVSPAFAVMLRLALDAAEDTDGLVDPTLGAALVAAGYDADFPLLRDDGALAPPRRVARPAHAVRLIGSHVLVPAGVALDLNGVVKGRTVDDALALLAGDGFVSAGGDLAARGGAVVELPSGGAVRLVHGALATSGTDRRRWTRGGRTHHHLIDPRTGVPGRSPWLLVTACAATCAGADVAAKAGFLVGPDGPDWLDARGVPGRFVTPDGTVEANESWRRSLERETACI